MLDPSELERYARHIVLREVGGPGQAKLKAARVLVIGAGGLGAPVLLYLAAAGIGTLGVVDDDVVSLSNLQRQVIHATPDIGMRKVDSAEAAITRLNPHASGVTRRTESACEASRLEAGQGDSVVRDDVAERGQLGTQPDAEADELARQPDCCRFDGFAVLHWPVRELPHSSPPSLERSLHQEDALLAPDHDTGFPHFHGLRAPGPCGHVALYS